MKSGEEILIKATVLRVDGTRLDAQTPDGQLIQTHVSNACLSERSKAIKNAPENKAVLNAPENKSKK
jgi:hypothetical protein